MNIARKYAEELRDETNYSPTWFPNVKIEVGAVCRLRNFQYEQVSDLASKGIPFQTVGGPGADITYASSGVTSMSLSAGGATSGAASAVGDAGASAKIGFKKAGGIVFEATGCRSTRIKDLEAIGKKILDKHDAGEWDPDLVVVTEVISAQGATILISSADNASVDVSAHGNAVPSLGNLAKLAAGLQLSNENSIGVKVMGSELTPLFRASGVKRRFLGSTEFRGMREESDRGPASDDQSSFGRVDYEDFADGE